MNNTLAVCKRELKSYFTTPMGYIILATFALMAGLYFARSFMEYAAYTVQPRLLGLEAPPDLEGWFLSPYLVFCGQLIMFMGPLVTMRLLADERSRGTIELLLTYPLTDRQIVFGKYLAALAIVVLMVAIVVVHMAVLAYFTSVEWAVLGLGLVAVALMGAAFTSMGLFISAVSSNQVTAGVLTFALWLGSYIGGTLARDLGETVAVPEGWPAAVQTGLQAIYGLVRAILTEMPLDAHAQEMAEGLLRPVDLVYYALVIALFLFLTLRALESRRWRV